jgi:hypothetical protein
MACGKGYDRILDTQSLHPTLFYPIQQQRIHDLRTFVMGTMADVRKIDQFDCGVEFDQFLGDRRGYEAIALTPHQQHR